MTNIFEENAYTKEIETKIKEINEKNKTVEAGATIPSSFRKIISYRKKGLIDLNEKFEITTETYEFPNNDSVKNTDLALYKI